METRYKQIRLTKAYCIVYIIFSGTIAGISSTLLAYFTRGFIDPTAVNNGILSGFVAITGPAGLVQPEGAIIIGTVAGIIYQGTLVVQIFLLNCKFILYILMVLPIGRL